MIALLAVGCATAPDEIPSDEFPRWAADVVCDRSRECLRGEYESAFYGQEDCRATLEATYESVVFTADLLGCDYAAGRAGNAVAEVAAMSCEEIYEGELEVVLLEVWEGCEADPTEPYTYYGYYTF